MGGDELSVNQKRLLVVRIGFEGEPSTFKNVPRFRLNPATINKLFNCDIEFLQSSSDGSAVFPDGWVANCMPPPASYVIRERVWPTLEPDAMEQAEYRGGSRVVVEHVPPEVTASALATWLRAGLLDDDAEYGAHAQRLKDLRDKLDSVVRMIAELPSLKLGDGAAGDAGDLSAKAERAKLLGAQRERLEREVAAQEARWAELEGGLDDTMGGAFALKLAETRMPLRLNTWEVSFAPSEKAQRMAFVAVHKFNWRDFRLAVRESDGAEPVTAKGDFEKGALLAGHSEVNMRDVTIARRKHGRGLYRFVDERGFYSGQWRRGLRHGQGTEISQQGRFQGSFRKDWRRGPGSLVTAGGDVFRGPFAASLHHPRESLLFGDEYADGQPCGLGRAKFVDGSVYEGAWADGCPRGKGRYVGADGLILEGEFGEWGRLRGLGSETAHGRTRLGRWRHGQLHGASCTEMDAEGGTYEGGFQHGQRHGYGVDESGILHEGRYDGWWGRGQRQWRGVYDFCEPPSRTGTFVGPSASSEADADALRAAARVREAAAARAPPPQTAAAAAAAAGAGGASAPVSFLAGSGRAAAAEPSRGGASGGSDGITDPSASAKRDVPHLIPYRGDYRVECAWSGGLPRGGGVFTYRHGHATYVRHSQGFVHDGLNPQLPHIGGLEAAERSLEAKRDAQCTTATASTLDARLRKEADNATSYAYWRELAEGAFRGEVVRRTRRLRRTVDLIREDVTGARVPPPDMGFHAGELAQLAAQEEWLDDPEDDEDEDAEEGGEGGSYRGPGNSRSTGINTRSSGTGDSALTTTGGMHRTVRLQAPPTMATTSRR